MHDLFELLRDLPYTVVDAAEDAWDLRRSLRRGFWAFLGLVVVIAVVILLKIG